MAVSNMCNEKYAIYNRRNLQPSRWNFGILQEIVVEEYDGDVVLYIGYGADSMFHRMYC